MNRTAISVILLFTVFMASCKSPDRKVSPPAADLYRTHSGKAVITRISESRDETGREIRGYSDIYFDFTPSDPGASEKYLCGHCSDKGIKLFYDNRDSFHQNWVKKWDITPGKVYPAIRHELLRKDKSSAVSYEVLLEPAASTEQ